MKKYTDMLRRCTAALIVALCCLAASPAFVSCDDDDDVTSGLVIADLPQASFDFVKEYFADAEVIKVEKKSEKGVITYEVDFRDGYDVTFNELGQWIDVDAPEGQSIPAGILPVKIADYLAANYPRLGANEIERQSDRFEVELVNGIELYFDLQGNFIRATA